MTGMNGMMQKFKGCINQVRKVRQNPTLQFLVRHEPTEQLRN